jgi:hypothetical protein
MQLHNEWFSDDFFGYNPDYEHFDCIATIGPGAII